MSGYLREVILSLGLSCLIRDTDRKTNPESEDKISSKNIVHKILIKARLIVNSEDEAQEINKIVSRTEK